MPFGLRSWGPIYEALIDKVALCPALLKGVTTPLRRTANAQSPGLTRYASAGKPSHDCLQRTGSPWSTNVSTPQICAVAQP